MVPPIRIHRTSPSPDLEAEFVASSDFVDIVHNFVEEIGNNLPAPQGEEEQAPDPQQVHRNPQEDQTGESQEYGGTQEHTTVVDRGEPSGSERADGLPPIGQLPQEPELSRDFSSPPVGGTAIRKEQAAGLPPNGHQNQREESNHTSEEHYESTHKRKRAIGIPPNGHQSQEEEAQFTGGSKRNPLTPLLNQITRPEQSTRKGKEHAGIENSCGLWPRPRRIKTKRKFGPKIRRQPTENTQSVSLPPLEVPYCNTDAEEIEELLREIDRTRNGDIPLQVTLPCRAIKRVTDGSPRVDVRRNADSAPLRVVSNPSLIMMKRP